MTLTKKTWGDSTNELTSATPDGTEIARLRKSDGTVVKATTQAIGNLGTAALIADLASTATGKGASTIGIEDAGAKITATTVEGALAENRTAIDAIEADYLQAADIANMLETADIGVSVQAHSAVLDATTASFTTADETKLDHISVTQAVDLDALETAVAALDQATVLKGTWDASAGTFPGAGAAQAGWTYIVSVAGTVDSVAFAQNDRILAIVDNASTTTYAANWFKLDYTDQVLSVAGKTGAVTLDADDIDDTSTTNKFTTAADISKLAGIESGATADQSAAEIETAYNSQVAQVSGGEKTAGTETAIRRFSPADVASMASIHGGGGGGAVVARIQTFTASGTYTPHASMVFCVIECQGGGGGGGGTANAAAGSTACGGGGGGGAYSRVAKTAADIGASQTVTIGAAGAGGAAGNNDGTSGGTTSVGTLCTAAGGTLGAGNDGTQHGTGGGAGGSTGTGVMQSGQAGASRITLTFYVAGGGGGSSAMGGGGRENVFTGNGLAASGYGGGGTGGRVYGASGAAAGGAGTAGFVRITEYCSA